jgi:hypothetical protein
MMIDKTVSKDMPCLVFHEMNPVGAVATIKGKGPTSIKCVHIVHPSERQVYVVRDLHMSPHYSIAGQDLDQFRRKCKTKLSPKAAFVEYASTQSHTGGQFI